MSRGAVRVVGGGGIGSVYEFDETSRGLNGRAEQVLRIPVTEHGTWDRWRLHAALGEEPCEPCKAACAKYWAEHPPARRRSRKGQHRG